MWEANVRGSFTGVKATNLRLGSYVSVTYNCIFYVLTAHGLIFMSALWMQD